MNKWESWDQKSTQAPYWRSFLNDAGNNWSFRAPKFAFAQKTSVNCTTGKTPYEIVFGTKPQIPMSLVLGLYRNKRKLCCSDFCTDLPPHSHDESAMKNQLLDFPFADNCFKYFWKANTILKAFIPLYLKDVASRLLNHLNIEIQLLWDTTLNFTKISFLKVIAKTCQKVKKYNIVDWDRLQSLNVSPAQFMRFKMMKTLQL